MKTIDNFDIISRLLNFKSEDDFYFCQIIKRRKDNPDLPRSEKLIKDYYLKEGDLEKCRDNIINTCELNNARAYFRLNKRNYKHVAYQMNVKLAKYLAEKQYKACEHLFRVCRGQAQQGRLPQGPPYRPRRALRPPPIRTDTGRREGFSISRFDRSIRPAVCIPACPGRMPTCPERGAEP